MWYPVAHLIFNRPPCALIEYPPRFKTNKLQGISFAEPKWLSRGYAGYRFEPSWLRQEVCLCSGLIVRPSCTILEGCKTAHTVSSASFLLQWNDYQSGTHSSRKTGLRFSKVTVALAPKPLFELGPHDGPISSCTALKRVIPGITQEMAWKLFPRGNRL